MKVRYPILMVKLNCVLGAKVILEIDGQEIVSMTDAYRLIRRCAKTFSARESGSIQFPNLSHLPASMSTG